MSVTLVDRASTFLATRLTQGSMELPGFLRPFDAALAAYWSLVQRAL